MRRGNERRRRVEINRRSQGKRRGGESREKRREAKEQRGGEKMKVGTIRGVEREKPGGE